MIQNNRELPMKRRSNIRDTMPLMSCMPPRKPKCTTNETILEKLQIKTVLCDNSFIARSLLLNGPDAPVGFGLTGDIARADLFAKISDLMGAVSASFERRND